MADAAEQMPFLHEFRSLLPALSLIGREAVPEILNDRWAKFSQNPLSFFMRCSDAEAEAMWRAAAHVRDMVTATRQRYDDKEPV